MEALENFAIATANGLDFQNPAIHLHPQDVVDEWTLWRNRLDGTTYWFADTTGHTMSKDGEAIPVLKKSGLNISRLVFNPETGNYRVIHREIFFSVDPQKNQIIESDEALQFHLSYINGVRNNQACTAIDFHWNGRNLANEGMNPITVNRMVYDDEIHFTITPLVFSHLNPHHWMQSMYHVKFPISDRGIYSQVEVYWKRYTITKKGPIDFGGIARKFYNFEDVANLHPLAEQIISIIDKNYPLFKDAPTSIHDLGGMPVTGLEADFPIEI